jgi:F420 biosynthesis protein FbiB-like protein
MLQYAHLLEIIVTRRSVRRYQARAVSRDLIEQLLDAARWAPSAHNRQPWRFVVIETVETKRALASAMGDKLRADLERDGTPPALIEAEVARSYARITAAPVLLVVCMTMREMDPYPDELRQRAEWTMATQSVAMAAQNLLLAAHSLGLAACWLCAPLFVPEIVREVLGLDDDWEPQALITLGYPADVKVKTRAPLEGIVKYVGS